jgi:hypothetical protein
LFIKNTLTRRVLQERTIIHQNRHTDNYSEAHKIKQRRENKKLKLSRGYKGQVTSGKEHSLSTGGR